MNVVDIYSKRQKRLRGEVPDVYQYETIPIELRVQVVHILNDAFGAPDYILTRRIWNFPTALLTHTISSTQPCVVNMVASTLTTPWMILNTLW